MSLAIANSVSKFCMLSMSIQLKVLAIFNCHQNADVSSIASQGSEDWKQFFSFIDLFECRTQEIFVNLTAFLGEKLSGKIHINKHFFIEDFIVTFNLEGIKRDQNTFLLCSIKIQQLRSLMKENFKWGIQSQRSFGSCKSYSARNQN